MQLRRKIRNLPQPHGDHWWTWAHAASTEWCCASLPTPKPAQALIVCSSYRWNTSQAFSTVSLVERHSSQATWYKSWSLSRAYRELIFDQTLSLGRAYLSAAASKREANSMEADSRNSNLPEHISTVISTFQDLSALKLGPKVPTILRDQKGHSIQTEKGTNSNTNLCKWSATCSPWHPTQHLQHSPQNSSSPPCHARTWHETQWTWREYNAQKKYDDKTPYHSIAFSWDHNKVNIIGAVLQTYLAASIALWQLNPLPPQLMTMSVSEPLLNKSSKSLLSRFSDTGKWTVLPWPEMFTLSHTTDTCAKALGTWSEKFSLFQSPRRRRWACHWEEVRWSHPWGSPSW